MKQYICIDIGGTSIKYGIIPVSYTHLDVYKRQVNKRTVYHCSSAELSEFQQVGKILFFIGSFEIEVPYLPLAGAVPLHRRQVRKLS